MKIVHHKENSMVEILQNSLNVVQNLTWQLQNTNLQWGRFPAGITCCNVTKLIATSLEFGWGLWSSCHICQSALRCIPQGFPDLDAQLFRVLLLSMLTFGLCTELQWFEFCSVSVGARFGICLSAPFCQEKYPFAQHMGQDTSMNLPEVPECVSPGSVFVS